jgi:hypothetical protein
MRLLTQRKILFKKGALLIALLVIALFAVTGCEEDSFDNIIDREGSQTGKPVPGNSGLLNISGVTTSSLKLDWEPASDGDTDSGSLRYRIVKVNLADIDSLVGIDDYGDIVLDWTTNVQSLTITGLAPGETVYFNVQVRDSDGFMAAYLPASVTTNTDDSSGSGGSSSTGDTDTINMYAAGTRTGDIVSTFTSSARSDVDGICSAANPGLACGNIRAFISLSGSDCIQNFPANYSVPAKGEIISTTGNILGYRWEDILDGSVHMDLQTAGIALQSWWSGSNADGSFNSADTCNNWTDGTSGYQGLTGQHNETDGDWIANTPRNCNNSLELLCICW